MARGKAKKADSGKVDRDSVLAAIGKDGPKTADIATRMGADPVAIRNALTELEAAGLVHRTGQTRGTRWFVGAGSGLPPEPGEAPAKRRGRKPKAAAPAPVATGKKRRGGPRADGKLEAYKNRIGVEPDSKIASEAGVNARTVAAYRKRNGIGKPRRGAAAAAAAAPAAKGRAPRAASSSGPIAWRIDIRTKNDTTVRYVLAPSLVDAARAAVDGATALGGEVIGIGWAGRAL